MPPRVWLAANTLLYPEGGGHLWAYLNWALGLRAAGCDVVWLEGTEPDLTIAETQHFAALLRNALEPYGLGHLIALSPKREGTLPAEATAGYLDGKSAQGADLLVNMSYDPLPELQGRFRRTALIDIDPGLLQVWIDQDEMQLAPHDAYFTIGETIGQPGSPIPTGKIAWQHTFPCVALEWWPVAAAGPDAAYTTISHWYSSNWVEFNGEGYDNDKRTAFLPYLDLPSRIAQPLELALCLGTDEQDRLEPDESEEMQSLVRRGWRVRHAVEVASNPGDYCGYIGQSLGEFSCAKPSYVRLQAAWMSDRTVCYLASGKPAVVEHTGPSRFLPDSEGLFRFRNFDEAVSSFQTLASDYPRQCHRARALAESLFGAKKVAAHLVQRVLS